MPIHCQYYANPRSIFLWIFANPCQSMPILANPMPISGQSVTSYVLNHRTSPLCGMVPSLLGGWNPFHHAIPIPAQYRPILCQAWADPLQIQCKPSANRTPIQGHSLDQSRITFLSIYANPGQSNANFRPFPRAICPWIGTRFSPIGNRLAQDMPIKSQSETSYVVNHRTSPLYGW